MRQLRDLLVGGRRRVLGAQSLRAEGLEHETLQLVSHRAVAADLEVSHVDGPKVLINIEVSAEAANIDDVGRRYDWVVKLDTDTFIRPRQFRSIFDAYDPRLPSAARHVYVHVYVHVYRHV